MNNTFSQKDLEKFNKDGFLLWKKSAYSEELVKLAAVNGVEIRKPIPEYGSLYTPQ